MSSALLGAIISAVASTAGNIAMAEHQRRVNESYVDKQNAYNLPSEQVARLKAAGINPQGMANGSIIGANSSAQYSPYQSPLIEDVMSHASNSTLAFENAKDVKSTRGARINLINQQAAQARESAKNLNVSSAGQMILNEYIAAQQELELDEKSSRIRLNSGQYDFVKQQARQLQKYISDIMPAELSKLVSETKVNTLNLDVLLATINDLKSSAALKSAQTSTEGFKQENLAAQTDTEGIKQKEGAANADYVSQQAEKYGTIADKIIKQYGVTIDKIIAETGCTRVQAIGQIFKILADDYPTYYENHNPVNRLFGTFKGLF